MKTKLIKLKTNTEMSDFGLKSEASSFLLKVKEDTQFVLDFSDIKNKITKNPIEFVVSFEKPGVTVEIVGVYFLKNGEYLNFATTAKHMVPNTTCTTIIKGVLGDDARSNYIGKIIIDKQAQQTSSFLNDSVLVVGKNTKNESQPILEIEANDVKASHGATTGRISDMQKYYLQSRGLTERKATDLVIDGFFESVLEQVKDKKIRSEIAKGLK